MPIAVRCACGRSMSFRNEYAGSPVRCKRCGALLKVPAASATAEGRPSPEPVADEEATHEQRREYMVVTQGDRAFGGRFEPEKIGQVVNAYARRGWVVRSMTTASIHGLSGKRDEIIILLERDP
jgi:hypothetical protein